LNAVATFGKGRAPRTHSIGFGRRGKKKGETRNKRRAGLRRRRKHLILPRMPQPVGGRGNTYRSQNTTLLGERIVGCRSLILRRARAGWGEESLTRKTIHPPPKQKKPPKKNKKKNPITHPPKTQNHTTPPTPPPPQTKTNQPQPTLSRSSVREKISTQENHDA